MYRYSSTAFENYVPDGTVPVLHAYLNKLEIKLRIVNPRKSKLGDYRPPSGAKGHRISVNNDLNKYAFLLTLVHEIAHAYNYDRNKNKVAPHGPEWKDCFARLMQPFLNRNTLPPDVLAAVSNHLTGSNATSCNDPELVRAFRKYDKPEKNGSKVFLSELPVQETFLWRDGRMFRKMNKLRKRYRCRELQSNTIYLFSPVAEVELLRK